MNSDSTNIAEMQKGLQKGLQKQSEREAEPRKRRPNGTVKNMTELEYKEYIKSYNDKRGTRKKIIKKCEICNIECNSGNYSRHCKSLKHLQNINERVENFKLDTEGIN
jgi:hypothetical protein